MAGTNQRASVRLVQTVAVAASLVFVTILVVSSSTAAFVDKTDNDANHAYAGDVVLSDDDSGSSAFGNVPLAPGVTVSSCVNVRYDGTIGTRSAIRLYSSGTIGGTGLDEYLALKIEIGSGGSFASCSGFSPERVLSPAGGTLEDFGEGHTNLADGIDTQWTPTEAGDAQTFRFSLTLEDNDAAEDLTAQFGFTWEATA